MTAATPLPRRPPRRLECQVCHQHRPAHELVAAAVVRPQIVDRIRRDVPGWTAEGFICRRDLNEYRRRFVEELLAEEKGELTSLEQDVVASLARHEILAANVESEFQGKLSAGDRLADRIASFGGSWRFIILFLTLMALWMAVNVIGWLGRFDPYPFILLNLALSCLAALQAPVIMMSQNRQEARDRLRSENDYRVNLKAELEIRQLHEKIDHLLIHQWERLAEIQQIQLDLMSDLHKRRP